MNGCLRFMVIRAVGLSTAKLFGMETPISPVNRRIRSIVMNKTAEMAGCLPPCRLLARLLYRLRNGFATSFCPPVIRAHYMIPVPAEMKVFGKFNPANWRAIMSLSGQRKPATCR
ncbi:MAG: hypothetical protein ABI479_09420 [Gallionella sp.]